MENLKLVGFAQVTMDLIVEVTSLFNNHHSLKLPLSETSKSICTNEGKSDDQDSNLSNLLVEKGMLRVINENGKFKKSKQLTSQGLMTTCNQAVSIIMSCKLCKFKP
jgi:hypothetical protein